MTAGKSRFSIEVLERGYDDVLGFCWPVRVNPQPDECLSSWLHAAALANGISLSQLWRALGLHNVPALRNLDHDCPDWIIHSLAGQMRIYRHRLTEMLIDKQLVPILLRMPRASEQGGIVWLQYCPACWAEDSRPYFRRCWQLATLLHCREHYAGLRDRCPHCQFGIGFPHGDVLQEIHICQRCRSDLSDTPAYALDRLSERSSRAINDVLLFELNSGFISRTRLIEQLLSVPARFYGSRRERLSATSARRRRALYREITFSWNQYLPTAADEPAGEWRRFLLDNGGRAGEIIEIIDPEPKTPRRFRQHPTNHSSSWKRTAHSTAETSIYDLLKAYGDLLRRRGSS